jgi:hypothetical protein
VDDDGGADDGRGRESATTARDDDDDERERTTHGFLEEEVEHCLRSRDGRDDDGGVRCARVVIV